MDKQLLSDEDRSRLRGCTEAAALCAQLKRAYLHIPITSHFVDNLDVEVDKSIKRPAEKTGAYYDNLLASWQSQQKRTRRHRHQS